MPGAGCYPCSGAGQDSLTRGRRPDVGHRRRGTAEGRPEAPADRRRRRSGTSSLCPSDSVSIVPSDCSLSLTQSLSFLLTVALFLSCCLSCTDSLFSPAQAHGGGGPVRAPRVSGHAHLALGRQPRPQPLHCKPRLSPRPMVRLDFSFSLSARLVRSLHTFSRISARSESVKSRCCAELLLSQVESRRGAPSDRPRPPHRADEACQRRPPHHEALGREQGTEATVLGAPPTPTFRRIDVSHPSV